MGKTKPNSKFAPLSYPSLVRRWLREVKKQTNKNKK
jgi:hypothetical protein